MIRGFVYASREHPLFRASIGATVALPSRTPPWLVVDHALPSVIVSTWPGRLLAVEVTDAVTEDDIATLQHSALRPDAGYTRAFGVRILDEVPSAQLFGPHGAAVVQVIERAQRASLADAWCLAGADDPAAGQAYSDAWNTWLTAEQRSASIHAGGFHADTLLIPERARAGSPIHRGFLVVSSQVRERALELSGTSALVIDDEGESSLAPPWSAAASAFLHAAMALGAPDLVPDTDRPSLLRAWHALPPVE